MSRSGEFSWIDRYFAPLAGEGSFGLKDDAAQYAPPPGERLVVTQDTIVETIHFFPDDRPGDIARKVIRTNLSDVVAKGGRPDAFLLSLSIPDRWEDHDVADFAQGLAADMAIFSLRLLGGDTTRSPHGLMASVTMFGHIPDDAYVSRMGAAAGDEIYVLGNIGDAVLGLALRTGARTCEDSAPAQELIQRQSVPAVLPLAWQVVRSGASAAMDVSDGLLGDLSKMCAASEVQGKISLEAVPFSAAADQAFDMNDVEIRLEMATGGDDYVVLLSVPQSKSTTLRKAADALGYRCTRIGEICEPSGKSQERVGITFRGMPINPVTLSYEHR